MSGYYIHESLKTILPREIYERLLEQAEKEARGKVTDGKKRIITGS